METVVSVRTSSGARYARITEKHTTIDGFCMYEGIIAELYEAVSTLTPPQQEVIILHYGLYNTQPLPLECIARITHKRKQTLFSYRESALKKLRKRLQGLQWQ